MTFKVFFLLLLVAGVVIIVTRSSNDEKKFKRDLVAWEAYKGTQGCKVVEVKPRGLIIDTCWVCKDGVKRWGVQR